MGSGRRSSCTRTWPRGCPRRPKGKLEIVEFKYHHQGADQVAKTLGKKLGIPVRSSPLALEGGNLLADRGRVFVSTRVFADNKRMTPTQIEAELKRALRVEHVEWLKPLPDEPTGHVDMFAKLIAPNTMLVSDTIHPLQKPVMDAAAKRFKELGYKVVRSENAATAPTDPALKSWGLVRSYANSLVVNEVAYVPQYLTRRDVEMGVGALIAARDKAALALYRKAGLKVVPVPADDILVNHGSVHCMTNTFPEGVELTKLFPKG